MWGLIDFWLGAYKLVDLGAKRFTLGRELYLLEVALGLLRHFVACFMRTTTRRYFVEQVDPITFVCSRTLLNVSDWFTSIAYSSGILTSM